MLNQKWKTGRMKKDKLFVQRPYRELTVFEVELKKTMLDILASNLKQRQVCEDALFCPNLEKVKRHKKAEYNFFFYNEGCKVSTQPARRYLAQKPVLGWDIFWAVEDAVAAGVDMSSYHAYLQFIRTQAGGKTYGFLNAIIEFALCFLGPAEVQRRAKNGGAELWDWVIDCCYFYAHSFFATPWEGNLKEDFFVRFARPYLATESINLRLRPTSEVNDAKYMVDFVIEDTYLNKVVAGVSVKGYSYHYAKLKGSSSYLNRGEAREKRGNNLFRKELGAPVFVIISGSDEGRNKEFLEPQVRDMIATISNSHADRRYGD